jgi:sulfopyruvate decarboxylase TPP-binding subunit
MATVSETGLQAASVLDQLTRCGVTHIVWLPDSETGFMYQAMMQSPITLVPVCREGEAIPVAAGLIAGGKRPVVLIQSTGFFESGDSIRGMALDLRLPVLLMLGYRGYSGRDKPEGDSAARFLEPILSAWRIPFQVVESDAQGHYISEMYQKAQADRHPAAVLFGREYSR